MTPVGILLMSLPFVWLAVILVHAFTFDKEAYEESQKKWGPDSDWRTRGGNIEDSTWFGPAYLGVSALGTLFSIGALLFTWGATWAWITAGCVAFFVISGFNILQNGDSIKDWNGNV